MVKHPRQAARVDEKDGNAVALGYKHDAATVDTKKYPQYVKGSVCANCTLYAGKPADPWAPLRRPGRQAGERERLVRGLRQEGRLNAISPTSARKGSRDAAPFAVAALAHRSVDHATQTDPSDRTH